MRHRIAGNRLGRNSSLRKATVRDIAKATLTHQRVCTTKMKAKEARKLVERLITLGKKDTLAAKRKAFSILCDHSLVSNLFHKIAGRFKNRMGGYTRIIPLSIRRGDNAYLVYLELTEKEAVIVKKPVATKTKAKIDEESLQQKKEAVKGETKVQPREEKEVKKEQPPRQEKPVAPPQKTKPGKDKMKPKSVMGGIKRLFTKKPLE